jgi:uncharacterized membrane protein
MARNQTDGRDVSAGMTDTLAHNIEMLGQRRRSDRVGAPLGDKLADRITGFTGSMTFVTLHLALFGGWIAWNLWGSPKFDPSFVILAMVASVEAIFLSTFVLISQNRMASLADERADLNLHISLLAEHELSRLATLVGRIADRLGVDTEGTDLSEIEIDVRPDRVLDAIKGEDAITDEAR